MKAVRESWVINGKRDLDYKGPWINVCEHGMAKSCTEIFSQHDG